MGNRSTGVTLGDRERRVIRKLTAHGFTTKQIADVLGVGYELVVHVRQDMGLGPGRGNNKRRRDLSEQTIIDAYQRGVPVAYIAQVFDVSTKTIRDRLHAAGVELLPAGSAPHRPYSTRAR